MLQSSSSSPSELVSTLVATEFKPTLTSPPRSAEFLDGARAGLLQLLIGKPLACPHKEGTASADAFYAGANEGHRIHAGITAEGQATSFAPANSLASVIEQCADRALARACPHLQSSEAALYFTALLGHELINQDIEAGVRLLDLVDATTLQPAPPSPGAADEILVAARLTIERRNELDDQSLLHYFVGILGAGLEMAGRGDLTAALKQMSSTKGQAE